MIYYSRRIYRIQKQSTKGYFEMTAISIFQSINLKVFHLVFYEFSRFPSQASAASENIYIIEFE